MPSSLTQPYWDLWVTLCSQIPYVKFYIVYFGGRNMLAYSLIGNRHSKREYRETSLALKHKKKIALRLELKNVGKLKVFLNQPFLFSNCFQILIWVIYFKSHYNERANYKVLSYKITVLRYQCLKFFMLIKICSLSNFQSCTVSKHVSVSRQSRDTIFQSLGLGLKGLKPRSRLGLGTSKSRKMGKSWPHFQSERKNPQ